MVEALGEFIDAGRIKLFSLDSVNAEGFYNKSAHPFHRSYIQKQYSDYVRFEVVPYIYHHCQTPGIKLTFSATPIMQVEVPTTFTTSPGRTPAPIASQCASNAPTGIGIPGRRPSVAAHDGVKYPAI